MSHLMAMSETTKATTQPTPKIATSFAPNVPPLMKYLTSLSALAPNMTGMARKNVNLDATERVQPKSKPPMMVEPERDVPGISESTWKQPIPSAVFQLRSSSVVMEPKSRSSSSSSSSAVAAAGAAKCAPAGRPPDTTAREPNEPATAISSRLLARQFSITINSTPYTMSASATTGAL